MLRPAIQGLQQERLQLGAEPRPDLVRRADIVFREMAGDGELSWPLRGRAVLLAADLNAEGDRVALLERAWRDCDDDTARLLGVALAEAYYKEGRTEEARAVRDAFAERFPGDEGLKYFDYLKEESE